MNPAAKDQNRQETNSRQVSRFAIPDLADVPEDIREKILLVQEKSGFVPNVFLTLSRRPEEFRAFFAYHDALMVKETGSLTKADREMIVTATSAKNNCLYCVMAHGAILRIYAKNPHIADQVAINHHKADITPRQMAMLDFAIKVCLDSQSIGELDYETLRGHGFDDEDIWDITSITAFFGMSNRIANTISMRPNDEFYLLGRLPKK
ncbi:MAG TPA: alkylhydroperoxidase [Alcaligenaceae bacterium]|nr:alkylhydroperoxidase [Alcaligenaceae bacterium]